MIYLLKKVELEGLMKAECLCAFLPSDRFHLTDLLTYSLRKLWKSHSWLILIFNANKIKIVKFTKESVFMSRKDCALFMRRKACAVFMLRKACAVFIHRKACAVFMRRKACAEIESEFDVRILKVRSLSIPSDRFSRF